MANFSIKIDLLKMRGAFMQNLKGSTVTKRCLVIPVDETDGVFVGEKGVYLNLTAVAMEQARYSDTHYIKPNLDKDAYYALSEEARKAIPIIGGMHELQSRAAAQQSQGGYAPQPYQAPTPQAAQAPVAAAGGVDDDLPF